MCHRKTSLNFLQICLTVELINKSGFQGLPVVNGQMWQNMCCCVVVWLMSNWRSCSSISNRQQKSVKSQHLHFCMNHWTIKEPSQKRLQKVVCYWIFWKGVMQVCLDNSENGLLNKCWLVFYILNVASNTVKNHCSALSVQSLALLQRLSVNQMSLLPKKISHTSEDRVDFHHTIWTLFQHLLQNREIFCDWKNANENLSKAFY